MKQENTTENNMKKVKQLLDFAKTPPDGIVSYRDRNLIL